MAVLPPEKRAPPRPRVADTRSKVDELMLRPVFDHAAPPSALADVSRKRESVIERSMPEDATAPPESCDVVRSKKEESTETSAEEIAPPCAKMRPNKRAHEQNRQVNHVEKRVRRRSAWDRSTRARLGRGGRVDESAPSHVHSRRALDRTACPCKRRTPDEFRGQGDDSTRSIHCAAAKPGLDGLER